jgi:hypothetical protein
MTPIEQQLADLQTIHGGASLSPQLPTGAYLVTIPDVRLPAGWSHPVVTILFLAPPGYPSAQPDCFWVEPTGIRLAGGGTPQGTNDSNPIPSVGQRGTWFSWHIQHWNPNHDSLVTYFKVVMQRLRTVK